VSFVDEKINYVMPDLDLGVVIKNGTIHLGYDAAPS